MEISIPIFQKWLKPNLQSLLLLPRVHAEQHIPSTGQVHHPTAAAECLSHIFGSLCTQGQRQLW